MTHNGVTINGVYIDNEYSWDAGEGMGTGYSHNPPLFIPVSKGDTITGSGITFIYAK